MNVDPFGLEEPVGHRLQGVSGRGLYRPVAHRVHVLSVSVTDPAMHAWQPVVLFASWSKRPRAQGTHAVKPLDSSVW